MTQLQPSAQAFAEFDAVCDEFTEALRSADPQRDPLSLDTWVERVPLDMQSWLRDELTALQQESRAGQDITIPEDVDPRSYAAVTGCEIFQYLSEETQIELARQIHPSEFQEGEHLLRAGQQAVGLFLVTAGRVQVVGGDGQERYQIDTDGAGSVLGEMSLLTGYPCSADVVAVAPVQAFLLAKPEFDRLRDECPDLEIALDELVSDRLGGHRRDALCGKTLGGYRLRHRLGTGAMGVVYAAEQESDDVQRAVKMLRHRFIHRPNVVSRFEQEAELLRTLEHPNIVSFHEHFVAYRTRFIVLDLFDGADLKTVIRRHGPLSESTARGILGQIAAGLRYAHQQGVLHLDLKPANILVDRSGRVAITDFGLSRLVKCDQEDHDCVGTPPYMPPEQFLMYDIGPHCDWYALGCIAYELVSGERLFDTEDSARLLDGKLGLATDAWTDAFGSGEYRDYLRVAIEPAIPDRRLDLDQLAAWARPAEGLSAVFSHDVT